MLLVRDPLEGIVKGVQIYTAPKGGFTTFSQFYEIQNNASLYGSRLYAYGV